MNRTRLALVIGASLAAVATAPSASHAATLAPATIDGVDYVRYTGGAEANNLQVRPGPNGTVAFVDSGATITASAPTCDQISAHEARCATGLVPSLAVSLGDGNDRVTVDVDGRGLLSGGDGNDTLTGGAGDEALFGGTGNDVLDGRTGADLLSGQDGADTVRYAGRTAPVTVNLTTLTLREEGQAGEHDTVTADNESLVGGNGADALTGNAGANVLDGGPGNDGLAGGSGDDTVFGGAGDDVDDGGAGNDVIDGGAGNDAIDGGAGNDQVSGGSGADDLRGGPGADLLRARDGAVDRADCGADSDRIDADADDSVAGCEVGAPTPALPGVAPLPTPFSFIFGTFKLPTEPVVLEHGRVALTVSCPAATPLGRCSGVISLERFGHKAGKGKGKANARASRRTRRFRVGEQSYAVRAGKKAKVRVRISSVGRRAIKRSGTARLKVLLRRTKRARKSTRIGTLKVQASRRTKRRPARSAS